MQYISHYESPLGRILLAADEEGLTGLWFEGQKYFARSLRNEQEEKEIPCLKEQSAGWIFTFPEQSRIFPCLCIFLAPISRKGLGDPLRHPLRAYYDLRGDRRASGGGKRIVPHVGPGGRRRGGPQSHLDPGALSSGGGSLRQSHRLCRGPGSKSKIIDTGENGYAGTFIPKKGTAL